MIVAEVKGKTGRTYAVRGTAVKNCYKSALLLQGSPAGPPAGWQLLPSVVHRPADGAPAHDGHQAIRHVQGEGASTAARSRHRSP